VGGEPNKVRVLQRWIYFAVSGGAFAGGLFALSALAMLIVMTVARGPRHLTLEDIPALAAVAFLLTSLAILTTLAGAAVGAAFGAFIGLVNGALYEVVSEIGNGAVSRLSERLLPAISLIITVDLALLSVHPFGRVGPLVPAIAVAGLSAAVLGRYALAAAAPPVSPDWLARINALQARS
jgi:hypothetical protein